MGVPSFAANSPDLQNLNGVKSGDQFAGFWALFPLNGTPSLHMCACSADFRSLGCGLAATKLLHFLQ
jgi:hypothetical protein